MSADSILHQAELEAKRVVCQWIRKTLQETLLQALQATFTSSSTTSTSSSSSSSNTLHPNQHHHPNIIMELSTQGLQECIETVEKVSQVWQEKLRLAEHELVAEWVEEVFQQGMESLWNKEENSSSNSNTNSSPTTTEPPNQERMTEEIAESAAQNKTAIVEDSNTSQEENGSGATREDDSTTVPYAELRTLGRRTCRVGEGCVSTEEALKRLNDIGRRGESYWPLEWDLINQICEEIPKRLRYEDDTKKPAISYQVIPKALWEKKRQQERQQQQQGQQQDQPPSDQQQQQEEEPIGSAQETAAAEAELSSSQQTKDDAILSALLERKRKNFHRKSGATVRVAQKRRNTSEEPPTASRPPSNIFMSTHRVNEELSAYEKRQLDTLLHPDGNDNESSSAAPMVLFGALSKIGEIQHRLQQQLLDPELFLSDNKKARRQHRAAIQERLNPRRVLKNCDPQTYRSKVLKTEDGDKNQYLDLDLGWCLMEVRREGETKKRFLCFSSMEIALQDDDDEEEEEEEGTNGCVIHEDDTVVSTS